MMRETFNYQAAGNFENFSTENLANELAAFQQKSEHQRSIPWSWMAFRGPFEGFR
jgi:ABC-type thiamine transport system substrate-binding protein